MTVAYLEEQKEAGNSLPAQVARLERYCQNKGFDILQVCSFDESAYKTNREEFDQIIDLILKQQEKIVVCCDKVDRLTRNMFDKRVSLLYEKALKDELELHFVSDGQILNSHISATEKFQFSISLGLAKYYSDAVSDNVRRAIEQKIRKGEWLSKAPYGYKNIVNPDGSKGIIVDDYEAEIVQTVFEWYATGVYSMDMVRRKLKNDYDIVWIKSFIDKILKRHFYYGVMEVKGKLYPHCYPPIISKELFDTVQHVKDGFNKKTRVKYAGRPYIYRGLIRCAHCGLAITPEKHKGHVYYHCTQYNGKHGAKWLREEEITKMMDNLYLDKLKGRITDNEYDRFFHSFCKQRDEIATHLSRLEQAETDYYITAKYILDLSNRAYELFKSSEVEEKRQLIKLVLSNLKLEDENLVYDLQKPFDLIINMEGNVRWLPESFFSE